MKSPVGTLSVISALFASILTSQASQASESTPEVEALRGRLPAKMVCKAANPVAQEGSSKGIFIEGLNVSQQQTQISLDGDVDAMELNSQSLGIVFHNGCDNYYQFVFVTDDLLSLSAGESKTIKGLVRFHNAYMPEGTDVETTTLECKIGF
jgi:hypothetical protein